MSAPAASWPAGTTDTLAFRCKVGVVVPATNTIVQPEMEAMRPPGVTNHVTRMLLPPRPYDNMEVYKRALETEQGNLEDALRLLLPCEPHVVAHGHSIHSFRGDLARAEADAAALTAFCGRPFITPSTAVVQGVRAIGNPQRLGVLTPYWPPAGELVANFFRSAGYTVARIVNMEARGPTNVGKITLEAIHAAFEQLADDDVEAFVHVGTALPISAITPQIEQRHGRPLIGVNVATYWAALRAAGIADRVQGFGRLLASH
jgi:maleate isomerase